MTIPQAFQGHTDYEDYSMIGSPPLGVAAFTLDAEGKVEIHYGELYCRISLGDRGLCSASFSDRSALCNHVRRFHRLLISPSAHGPGKASVVFANQEMLWYSSIMNTHHQLAAQGLQPQQPQQQQPARPSGAAAEGDNDNDNDPYTPDQDE